MSTNVSPTSTTTVKRRNKEGHVENVTCPLSDQLYNSYMGGVDRADQLRGYYRVRMKSHKYYRFVLLNLLVFHSLYFILFFLSPQQIHLLVSRGLLHCECLYSPEILSAKHWKHDQATSIQGIQAWIGTGADWELQFQAALCTSTSTLWCSTQLHVDTCKEEEKRGWYNCTYPRRTLPHKRFYRVAATAGMSREGDMTLVWGVGGVGRRCVLSTGIHPRKAPPASSATTPSSYS